MEKQKNWLVLGLTAAFLFGFALWSLLKADDAVSESERRALAQRPELSWETVWSGDFMEDYESYTLDQFPLRDEFRALKAHTQLDVLRQKDNNGIYVAEGYAAKLEYPENAASVERVLERFQYLYERYLQGSDVYVAVIPDKGAYLAQKNGYPALDYAAFMQEIYDGMDYAEPIELMGVLGLDSYYRTDIHWRQEVLHPVAETICAAMGAEAGTDYAMLEVGTPFYGVYSGQSALPLEPDTLRYLYNETLRGCTLYDYETDAEIPLYDLEAAAGTDGYAMFLGGSKALLELRNPNAKTDRELVIFRDSFGSSLAPLLLEGYAKITLVDIRYLAPERLGQWLSFEGQDVLFLYSVSVLNNSEAIL